MRLIQQPAPPDIEAARQAVLAALNEHMGNRPVEDMVAVSSFVTGQLLAMVDKTRFTPETAMALCAANIEDGNRSIVEAAARGEINPEEVARG